MHSSLRIQFLGEVAESEPVRDNKHPVFSFSRTFERVVNASLFDALLNNGLDVVVLEGSSHRSTLGTAHVDLTPLVL